jgi:hypothetical protein
MKKTSGLVVCILLLAGCYTQFAHRNRMMSDQYMPTDSVMASDSVRAHLPDTLKVNSNQVCYWTRDIYGQPQLRCDDSYYGRDWYRYNNSPWWNSSSSYYYGDYNSYGWDEPCPAYYYYDNTCGACRYYRDYEGQRDWWWDNPGRGFSSSSSPTNTTPSRTLHTRTEGIPTRADRVTGSPTSQTSSKEVAKQSAGTATIIGETGTSETPPVRALHTRTEGIPASDEARDQQNASDAAAREMNKRIEAERAQDVAPPSPPPSQGNGQESSPPPAPSQNTSSQQQGSGQDNQSGRDRHNTRGW